MTLRAGGTGSDKTSGADKLRELRAEMDADLERFRDRLALARELSEAAAREATTPAPPAEGPSSREGDDECYRPSTWLV